MRKSIIAIVLSITLISMIGCKPKSTVITPPIGVLPKEPAKFKTSATAQAYIDAIDNSLRDYANRDDVKKSPIQYISFDINSIEILSKQDKLDIAKFIEGYGIPFDQKGVAYERTIDEMQNGIAFEVIWNPSTDHFEVGTDLLLQVKLYKGPTGRGYFANFKSYHKRYILTYIRDWEYYSYR